VSSADHAASDGPSLTLGPTLQNLRKSRRLTGKRLAELAGMSQSKISRIENGVGAAPSAEDVERLARVLGAGEALSLQLVEEARQLREPVGDWEVGDVDLASRQQDTEQLELAATHFKVFQPTVVIGLLQTGGYAKAVLSALQRLTVPGSAGGEARAVYGAVSVRVHRQAILSDPDKHFDFVMSEAVLSNRICPIEEMPAQLLRIREVAAQPNVTVSIIPADAHWSIPPYHGFSILDDRHLFVDLYDTGLSKHDQSDADLYGGVFDAMKELAVRDIEPILERYRRQYARELAAD